MAKVGVKQLRDQLSGWLERVEAGEDVVVTSHGRPVARISRLGPSRLDELAARGLVTPARSSVRDVVPHPVVGAGPLSDLVAEQRGD